MNEVTRLDPAARVGAAFVAAGGEPLPLREAGEQGTAGELRVQQDGSLMNTGSVLGRGAVGGEGIVAC